MLSNAGQNQPNAAKLIGQLILYVLAFAGPAAILIYLLPDYAVWILLTTISLMIGVMAFHIGWIWDNPSWTRETRKHAANLLWIMIMTAAANQMRHVDLIMLGVVVGWIGSVTLIPFVLGRWLKRRMA